VVAVVAGYFGSLPEANILLFLLESKPQLPRAEFIGSKTPSRHATLSARADADRIPGIG